MQEMPEHTAYVAGGCNIGPVEIRKRYRIGFIGFGLMVIFIFTAEFLGFPQTWKLALFAPTVYCLSGFLQAWQRFCFLFGFLGVFSFSERRSRIADGLQIRKDRMKALWLVTQVCIGSLIVTLLYYFLSPG